MGRKARFLLASKLSRFRNGDGATWAFRDAIQNAKSSEPEMIFADSLSSYVQDIDYAFIGRKEPKLVGNSGIGKPHATNNSIERLNGTLREKVKVQRGWKSMETPIAEGQRIQYNLVKPHSAFGGQTPAQAALIPVVARINEWTCWS